MINILNKTWDRQAIYKIYWISENLKLFQIFIILLEFKHKRNTIDWSKNGLQIHRIIIIYIASAFTSSLLRTIAFPGWLRRWGRVPFPKIKSQHQHTRTELCDTFCSIFQIISMSVLNSKYAKNFTYFQDNIFFLIPQVIKIMFGDVCQKWVHILPKINFKVSLKFCFLNLPDISILTQVSRTSKFPYLVGHFTFLNAAASC